MIHGRTIIMLMLTNKLSSFNHLETLQLSKFLNLSLTFSIIFFIAVWQVLQIMIGYGEPSLWRKNSNLFLAFT